jgi:hypothetical protein
VGYVFFLIDIDLNESSAYFVKQLNIAWILGLIYFVVGLFEGAADYFRFAEDSMIFNNIVFIGIKLVVVISFVFFQRGYILIGGLFNNYLLKITSYLLIVFTALIIGYEIASVFYDSSEEVYIMGGATLTFGSILIVHGIALIRLKDAVGVAVTLAGVFAIISGVLLMTILLSFVGLFFTIPLELLQTFTLYKVVELIRAKQKESII